MTGERAERPLYGPRVVRVRLEGLPDGVAYAADRVRMVLDVVDESADYRNRPPRQERVRRYLDIVIDGPDLLAAEVAR